MTQVGAGQGRIAVSPLLHEPRAVKIGSTSQADLKHAEAASPGQVSAETCEFFRTLQQLATCAATLWFRVQSSRDGRAISSSVQEITGSQKVPCHHSHSK